MSAPDEGTVNFVESYWYDKHENCSYFNIRFTTSDGIKKSGTVKIPNVNIHAGDFPIELLVKARRNALWQVGLVK